ncbi:hypothetical protein WJX81_003940 [Elliptochloris bilobata]|uniref:protein O-GlcNAc transferase n=1 Tax=Elliptochloris bilobata TaxID=381761 RepID=A0AAW1RGS3_9CHLO
MEDVPSLDPSYDLSGVQKKSVPLVCQVLGCGKRMDDEENPEGDYYQRYRVCQAHLTLSVLLKQSVPQRFCQQCGRFHHLAAFDGSRRSCRQRLNAHNDRRRKRVGGDGGSELRSSYRGRGRPRQVRGGRRRSSRRKKGGSDEDEEDSEEQEEACSEDSAGWTMGGRRGVEAAEAGGSGDEGGRARYHLRPRSARAAREEPPPPPPVPPDARRLLPPEILHVMDLLEGMRETREGGGNGSDLEAALQSQAAAHVAAGAAYAVGMRRHQSDPVGAPQRADELSGALIASLSSPNPQRAAAAAVAEHQGLTQGTLPPDFPLGSSAAYGRVSEGKLSLDTARAGVSTEALGWLQALTGPGSAATAAGGAAQAEARGRVNDETGFWAPSRLAGRPPSLLLDSASRAQAAAFQHMVAQAAQMQAPPSLAAAAALGAARGRELAPEGLPPPPPYPGGGLPLPALEALLRCAPGEVPPQLFGGEALGLGEARGGPGEAHGGVERMSSADEARASMQRARSAEATLSGMTLGVGGAVDPGLARSRRIASVELGAPGAGRLGANPNPARLPARTLSGGLQNIAEDAPGACGVAMPEENVATLARMLQVYDQGLPIGSPPDTPAKGTLNAPHRRRYDHPGMLELQAAAQHGWGSSPPAQPSVLNALAEGPPPADSWPLPPPARELEATLGGPGEVANLQAAVRPGCVHIVADALVAAVHGGMGPEAAAARLLAGSPVFRTGRTLLQLPAGAVLLVNGAVAGTWDRQAVEPELPHAPCSAPFAALLGGKLRLRLAQPPPRESGQPPAARLLVRFDGRFLADVPLPAEDAAGNGQAHVMVDTAGAGRAGVAWVEAEAGGLLGWPAPVVLADSPDIVREIRSLEADVAAGRIALAAVAPLLADVGRVLQYAQFLALPAPAAGAPPAAGAWSEGAVHELQRPFAVLHVTAAARRLFALAVACGWAALAAKVLPVAAVGCMRMHEVVAAAEAAYDARTLGGLLHVALRARCLAVVDLLLDLTAHGMVWDLTGQAGVAGASALHVAAAAGDGGATAGLLLLRCPEAGGLWSSLRDAAGLTPQDVADQSCAGRFFSLLSPAERAALPASPLSPVSCESSASLGQTSSGSLGLACAAEAEVTAAEASAARTDKGCSSGELLGGAAEESDDDAQSDYDQTPPLGANHAAFDSTLADAHQFYRAGDYISALSKCNEIYPQFNDRCIMLDSQLAEAHANLANALQQIGNFDMAVIYYQSALRLKPTFTDAYNNLASALVQQGRVPAALQCYQAALAVDPTLVDVYNNMGDLWRAQGVVGRNVAQRCYGQALQVSSGYAPAWRGLADLLREAADHGSAVACYQEAVRLRPAYADAFTGMGMALKELKRRDEAEACFSQVVRLRPGCALSLGNLAGVYYEQGKLQLAIDTYRQAIAHEPHFPEAYNNLGNALREAGRSEEAVQCYTLCIQLQLSGPSGPGAAGALGGGPGAAAYGATHPAAATLAQAARLSVAYNNLGGILKMQGRAAEAIACYEQVALLHPDSPDAHANLASSYKDAARQDVAVAAYRRALALRPDFPEAFANLVHSLQCVCEWHDRPALFARLEAEVRRDLAAGRLPPVQPFHAMAYPFSAELALAISAKYAEFCAATAARLRQPPLAHPPAQPLAPGERLRIAYVSSDFGNHPLSHLMGSVFGLHNRAQIEVFCYALSANDGSEWRQRIEAEAERFLDVSAWSVGDIAARISADRIHVAINLNGYTKGARNEIFALNPAPVQTSYMGFPATTGAPFLPYLITDRVVAPEGCRNCYSEHLALMPNCYFVNDYKRAHMDVVDEASLPRRAEVGLPDDRIVFACSNQLYKYDPETFQTWCNILRRVPASVLWLLRFPPYGEPRIRAEAAARGVDPSRIIFTDVAAKPIHIRRSGLADVFLDTPLCNAHTTGCDVLWGGCPMVTLPLERMASRVAASLCYATGLGPEMVVSSQQEYEERAVELGLNHALRSSLRQRLKAARLTCPLFDTRGWVADFERVLLRMWAIHCEGRGPRSFEV